MVGVKVAVRRATGETIGHAERLSTTFPQKLKIISSSSQVPENQSAPSTKYKPRPPLYKSNRTYQPPIKRSPLPSSPQSVAIYKGWDGLDGVHINDQRIHQGIEPAIHQGITARINSPAPYNIRNAPAYRYDSNQARVSAISASVPLQRRNSNVPMIVRNPLSFHYSESQFTWDKTPSRVSLPEWILITNSKCRQAFNFVDNLLLHK